MRSLLSLLVASAAAQEDTFLLPHQRSALTFAERSNGTQASYDGQYRPQVHYSPPSGFMNDPNGMFRSSDGTWHLYFQYNPTSTVAGNQHWGHATSSDLYHWENQPIAIYPPAPGVGVFSGSAVVDTNNTSGFFPNTTDGVVAIYTLNYPPVNGTAGLEVQAIAYSTDNGYSFTPYGHVLDLGSDQFRDPKVIRYGDHWVMAVALAQEYTVQFYTSPNLKDWTFGSNFTLHGLLGLQYECPNMVEIDAPDGGKAWILVLSNNPGGPLGGSSTQYFPGEFNGTHFTPFDDATRLAEWGKDAYAGQFFYDTDYFIAWASNWQYCEGVPTGEREGWRSQMSIPRKLSLKNAYRQPWALAQEIDVSPVKGDQLACESNSTGSLNVAADVSDKTVYAEINITNISPDIESKGPGIGAGTVNWTLSNAAGDHLDGGYNLGSWLWVSREGTKGFANPLFTSQFSTTHLVDPATNSVFIQFVWDRDIIEMFADHTSVSTTTAFPNEPLTQLNVVADVAEGTSVSVTVHALDSVWQ